MQHATACFLSVAVLCAAGASAQTNTTQATDVATVPQFEVRLSGTDLYKALVDDVTREVDRAARERESDKWKTFSVAGSILIALVGFFGYRTLADLRRKVAVDVAEYLRGQNTFKSLVEEAVRAHVTADIEARLRTVAKELSFYRLSNLASSIRAGAGFTNTERDAAVEALEQLQNETDITGRKEFADALEKVLHSFASADLDYEIDTIDSSLQSVIMDTPGIVQIMLIHYGMRVLGDAEVSEETIKRFRKYAEACKRRRIYKLALPYLMVYEHSGGREGWKERVQAYILDARYLKPDEHKTVIEILERNSDPSRVASRATGQVLRLCEKFEAFAAQFGDEVQKVPEGGEKHEKPKDGVEGEEG